MYNKLIPSSDEMFINLKKLKNKGKKKPLTKVVSV